MLQYIKYVYLFLVTVDVYFQNISFSLLVSKKYLPVISQISNILQLLK